MQHMIPCWLFFLGRMIHIFMLFSIKLITQIYHMNRNCQTMPCTGLHVQHAEVQNILIGLFLVLEHYISCSSNENSVLVQLSYDSSGPRYIRLCLVLLTFSPSLPWWNGLFFTNLLITLVAVHQAPEHVWHGIIIAGLRLVDSQCIYIMKCLIQVIWLVHF